MNPPKFHAGQKCTPTKKDPMKVEWGEYSEPPPMLRFGEIYTIDNVFLYPDNVYGVTLCEIGRHISFNENRLDPIELSSESIEELIEQLHPIEVTPLSNR